MDSAVHLPALIQDLAIILGVAAIVTFTFRLIRQPVVLGYIVAGIIVGPYTPPIFSVKDVSSVKTWAELGVIFLMFALGLEFSFRRLAKVGISAAGTAVLQIITMIVLGYSCGKLLDWKPTDAIFLGCMIAISSTTIIIKALEELDLKSKRFAELVFGILIVEDLAAIIMLVALANIATAASFSSIALISVGGKLALVVGAWLIVGMFVVPRIVNAVSKRGNNEMIIIVSLGLCLALVSLSAYFEFSVALGAFIMGSILAETQEARRIEKLVSPLKDVFGAVFFVSVGMLLNPAVLLENLLPIAIICVVIIVGKIISVTLGAVATGQTISTSVHTGFSMAQIGEFSFIIATLGLSYDVIDERLYPIIVACSLITTFTTPYLVKVAPKTALLIENWLPSATKLLIERYITWFQRRSLSKKLGPAFYTKFLRWIANAIVVITVFALSANTLPDWFFNHFHNLALANLLSWAITLVACSPFIWGMLTISRKSSAKNSQQRLRDYPIGAGEFLSWLLTVLLLGFLSREFLSTWVSVAVTGGAAICLFFIFRKRLESYYHWLENNFIAGIEPGNHTEHDSGRSHAHLLPWEAHLIEVVVPPNSPVVGLTLQDLKIRESFGVSVVVIKRGGLDIIASKPNQTLFPHDTLLCFGSDEELDTFKAEINRVSSIEPMDRHLSQYVLRHVELPTGSPLIGKSVKQSGIREEFETMVVGIERDGIRIQNPNSDSVFKAGDLLWVVGEESSVDKLGKSKINAATIL